MPKSFQKKKTYEDILKTISPIRLFLRLGSSIIVLQRNCDVGLKEKARKFIGKTYMFQGVFINTGKVFKN